jgi:hypothetical protein
MQEFVRRFMDEHRKVLGVRHARQQRDFATRGQPSCWTDLAIVFEHDFLARNEVL